jgi:hypothetical protein
MTYVKPTTKLSTASGPQASSDSDVLVVDGVNATFGTAVQASAAGFGVTGTDGTNTHEILDALPLGRAAVQLAVEAGSADTDGGRAVDFASQDFLTSSDIAALDDSNNHIATSDLT